MNELEFFNAIAELTKQSIDNNPSFTEWEKWWRKCGVEQTKEFAKQYYITAKEDQVGLVMEKEKQNGDGGN